MTAAQQPPPRQRFANKSAQTTPTSSTGTPERFGKHTPTGSTGHQTLHHNNTRHTPKHGVVHKRIHPSTAAATARAQRQLSDRSARYTKNGWLGALRKPTPLRFSNASAKQWRLTHHNVAQGLHWTNRYWHHSSHRCNYTKHPAALLQPPTRYDCINSQQRRRTTLQLRAQQLATGQEPAGPNFNNTCNTNKQVAVDAHTTALPRPDLDHNNTHDNTQR